MPSRLAGAPWFAPLLAVYPALYIAVTNPGQVRPGPVAAVAAAVALAAVAALVILRPALRTWDRAGAAVTWLALLFYGYGPVNGWWIESAVAGLEEQAAPTSWVMQSPHLLQSAAWLLLFLAGLALLRRARDGGLAATRGILNIAAILLFALLGVQSLARDAPGRALAEAGTAVAGVEAVTGPRPDIYVIVLDGYARADVLREQYGFDNGPFLDALRQRGFQVGSASRANYNWTFLSLGSLLNYDYMQALLGDGLDPSGTDREQAYRLLRDNRAAAFLRRHGYRFVQLQSTWSGTGLNPLADEFVGCQAGIFGDEYLRAFADASWLRAASSRASMDIAHCHLQNFESLAAQGARPGPKFVLAHFLPPHHPYLFDRDGRILRHANLSDQFEFQKRLWERREPYVDQLMFVNGRILQAIDRVLADSASPPVILLLSDHGPNLRQGLTAQDHRRLRLANLSAVLLPGAPPSLVPNDSTPANLLRRVFNHYFDAGLPLLPDHFYVSPYSQPFAFTEVQGDGARLEPSP
jgi:hypothetical protein